MRSRIVKIGNSRGIRLPKPMLDQTGISGDVELAVDGNRIVICGVSEPRAGWGKAFQSMTASGDDAVIDGADGISNDWDSSEWQW